MKKKEFQQLKNKPLPEIQKDMLEYREKLRKLKFDLSQGKVKNISEIKETKKGDCENINDNKSMKRKLQGIIVSDKMAKTRVVMVTRLKKHPRYKKYYKLTRKFKAHDEKNEYKTGESVLIEETRPLSKDKRWRIIGKVN